MEGFAESAADVLSSEDVNLLEIGKYDKLFAKTEESDSHVEDNTQSHEHEEPKDEHNTDGAHNPISITGLSDHYHSGDSVKLIAETEEKINHGHWHWYTLEPEQKEW